MIEGVLPANPTNAPGKKFRGKKRYFKQVLQTAIRFSPSLGPDDWYDMWHYHADWEGYGNLSWRYRVKHIEALCIVFQKFMGGLDGLGKPCQLFIYLNRGDAGQDAVYFHTPNPNRDNFPFKLPEIHWGVPIIEDYFSKLLPDANIRAGQSEWQGSCYFSIYCPGIGEALE